uniref:Uncharacterized protein n=1 Tax=Oryza punctata TaxID=4537 RepID=A0A0E0LZD6_ORYPU
MATSSPTRGLHLQAGHLQHRRVTSSLLAPLGQPPTLSLGDIIPMHNGYFVTDWGLTPPGKPPTPLRVSSFLCMMATSSPTWGLHHQAYCLRRHQVTSSPCRMANLSPTGGFTCRPAAYAIAGGHPPKA